MSRIADTFQRLDRRRALVPFIMAGDPDLAATERLVPALVEAGADLVELGVPFSDPIADGPINQRAAMRALASGTTLLDVLALARRLRERAAVPLVLLSYYNPILALGPERFALEARAAGVDGVVIPDLPADEAGELAGPARAAGVDVIFLLAPTSTDARIQAAAREGSGFLYCVSLTGVTGVRQHLAAGVEELVRRIKRESDLPVVVGFGISTPEQARAAARAADGVIVGSALVQVLEEQGPQAGVAFVRAMREALP